MNILVNVKATVSYTRRIQSFEIRCKNTKSLERAILYKGTKSCQELL
jgi:hypothetical protein